MKRFLGIFFCVLFALPITSRAEELCTHGVLLFREDFGGNDPEDPRVGQDPVQGMTYSQLLKDIWKSMGSGKYLVTKSGYCNGDTSLTNLPQNRSSQWHLQDDHTYPDDKTRGYLLEIDGRGDNAAFYTTTIEGLCEGIELTFSAYVANVMTWGMYVGSPGRYTYPRLKFVLTNPTSSATLATYDTGEIPFDSAFIGDYKCWQKSVEWRLVGMNFTVHAGLNQIKLTIYNNTFGSTGNDFAIDDIEIHLCMIPDTIRTDTLICDTINQILWREKTFALADTLRDTLRSSCGFDSIYYVMKLETEHCCPDLLTLTADTVVCDTLMPYRWRDTLFTEPAQYEILYKDIRDCDSLLRILTLGTKVCCPDLLTITADTTVCDTLLPYRWRDTLFTEPATYEILYKDIRGCDSLLTILNLDTVHCEPPEPVLCTNGILLFREDFGGNNPSDPRVSTTPVSGMTYSQSTSTMGSGVYMITKSGYCNGDTTGWTIPGADRATKRSQWYIQDDHTYPNDYTRGYFMEIDGKGGNKQFYQTEINGLCEGIELTFSAYVANVFTWFQYDWYTKNRGPVIAPCLKFVLTNPQTGETLAEKNMQEIPFDENLPALTDWQYSSQWHLVGMNFTVPVGVNAIRLSIYNNVTNGNGNDFAIDDIEVHLCMTPDTVRTDTLVCDTLPQITWREKSFTMADTLRDTLRSNCGFDSIYYVMKVETEHCEPPIPPCPDLITIYADTTVCDTLMPYRWRDTLFTEPAQYEILYKDIRDCDSLLRILTLGIKVCCPEAIELMYDTLVCDTLLPFVWRNIEWTAAGIREINVPHPKWSTCTDSSYVLRLDTFHCERLYPVIVNKYNWQLLLDNVTLRQLLPDRSARAFQWYKNEQPIPGATADDYSEQNELNGRFQLRLELDNSQTIWSNILEINTDQAEQPLRVRIYDSHGMPVSEEQLTHGIYLYRFEQADKVWTEKKLIP